MEKDQFLNMTEKEQKEFIKIKSYINSLKDFPLNLNNEFKFEDVKNKMITNKYNMNALVIKDYYGFKLIKDVISETNLNSLNEIEFKGNSGFYNIEYLQKGMTIFNKMKKLSKGVKITMGEGLPIVIENKHLKYILAPRGDY